MGLGNIWLLWQRQSVDLAGKGAAGRVRQARGPRGPRAPAGREEAVCGEGVAPAASERSCERKPCPLPGGLQGSGLPTYVPPHLVNKPFREFSEKKKMLLGVTPFKFTSLVFCDLIFPLKYHWKSVSELSVLVSIETW